MNRNHVLGPVGGLVFAVIDYYKLYWDIPLSDLIAHFCGGLLVGYVAFLIADDWRLVVATVALTAVSVEVFEVVSPNYIGLYGAGWPDTVSDAAASIAGGVLIASALWGEANARR